MSGADGQWSIVVADDAKLSEAIHSLRAVATDAKGHVSEPTGAYVLTVDHTAPVLSQTVLNDRVGPKVGPIHDGDVIDDATPTSNAADGSWVALRLNGIFLGYTQVFGGKWSYDNTASELAIGYYGIRADLVDVAGNIAVSSAVRQMVVDTSGIRLPDGAHDPLSDQTISIDAVVTDTGVHDDDFITSETTLLIKGSSSAPEGSNIALRIDGVLIAYLTVHDHAWSYTYAFAPGTLGNFEVRADLVDVAGNIAVSSVVTR